MLRKRILFVYPFTPPINAGGGKNAFYFAAFLAKKGHNVTFLSLNWNRKPASTPDLP